MTERSQVEQLVKELHAARLAGDLERLCRAIRTGRAAADCGLQRRQAHRD